LDDIDEKIIAILKENGRTSYTDIGERTGLSEGAVRRRVNTLLETGNIKKFTIQVGLEKGTKAILLLSIKPSVPTSKISAALVNISGAEIVHEVTGEYDIAVFLYASNIKEINHCIEEVRGIDGVLSTNTMIILREWGSEY
jgi:DNA-binding Lrp family transcriptional regulator